MAAKGSADSLLHAYSRLIQRLATRTPGITIGTSIEGRDTMEIFSDTLNELETFTPLQRLAWGLHEVSKCTGLSVPFPRAEVRAGRLPVRRFGRRVLVRDEDLKAYLSRGSERESQTQ